MVRPGRAIVPRRPRAFNVPLPGLAPAASVAYGLSRAMPSRSERGRVTKLGERVAFDYDRRGWLRPRRLRACGSDRLALRFARW